MFRRQLEVQQRSIAETRNSLSKMKKGTKVIVDEKQLSASTSEKFDEQFGKNFEAILQNMFLHTLKKIELRSTQAPDLTQWSILLLGSLARSEGHPYSDIDMLILIDPDLENDEKAQKFFQQFMQEFADLVHQTGEECAGFKLCGGNLTPPYQPYEFHHADSGKQPNSATRGMGSFLTTPERLAVSFYQSAVSYMPIKGKGNFFKSPLSGNESLMGATLLDAQPVFGNLNLFDQFVELKNALGELKASELFKASHFSDAPWGPETTADQLAYAEECLHLIRLLQLKKKADPQAFKAASQVCLHVIEKINRYVAMHCDTRPL